MFAHSLTHGHEDHVGDTLEIAKSNDAMVIASFELATYFSGQGIERTSRETMVAGSTSAMAAGSPSHRPFIQAATRVSTWGCRRD